MFTEEQLDHLEKVFGLERKDIDRLPVSDGSVKRTSMVWWWNSQGPEHVLADDNWANIKAYPNFYSLAKPRVSSISYKGVNE